MKRATPLGGLISALLLLGLLPLAPSAAAPTAGAGAMALGYAGQGAASPQADCSAGMIFPRSQRSTAYYGLAYIGTDPAPAGTCVEAFVGSLKVGFWTTSTAGAYPMMPVDANELTPPAKNGANDGDVVTFYLNGLPATPTSVYRYDRDHPVRLDLVAGAALTPTPPTATPSATLSPVPSHTPTATTTVSRTPTPTLTTPGGPTATSTATPTATRSPTASATASATLAATATASPSPSPVTPLPTATDTLTPTPVTPTLTPTDTATPTPITPSPTVPTLTPTLSATAGPSPTLTPTRTESATPTETPYQSPTPTLPCTPVRLWFQQGVLPETAYNGVSDTYINIDDPTVSYGTSAVLRMKNDANGGVRPLLRFDLSLIPPGSYIESATLHLAQDTYKKNDLFDSTVGLYRLRRHWTAAEATWQRAVVGQAWTVAGADGALDRELLPVSTLFVERCSEWRWRLFPVREAVQGWVDLPSSNEGLILIGSGLSQEFRFYSANSPALDRRPKLEVFYCPAPPTPTCTPTATSSPTPTSTATSTPTSTGTPTPTDTLTPTPSATPTPTATPSPTPSATPTATVAPTDTVTPTPTASATAPPTETPTVTLTATATATATETVSPTVTATPTAVSSDTPVATASATATATLAPSVTPTPSASPTGPHTPTPTASPTSTELPTWTLLPARTPTATRTPGSTPTSTVPPGRLLLPLIVRFFWAGF
ncbi:MAG: hypothetical protein BWY10_02063 [Chloroflexi bacterium ADurb.Bin180]|nr:MAG: hypothetical protein BWY10_02063 [Chloroflexi bacterium ADurb.Bin180]